MNIFQEQQKIISNKVSKDKLDYLTEIFVADLIKAGFEYDDIDVKPQSLFKRGYKKDIEKVSTDGERLIFEISRNGLYDTLPESLFHEEVSYEEIARNKDNKRWVEKRRKKHDIEEEQARIFFFPFEKEFFRLRVDIELKEQFYYTNFERDLPTLKNIVSDIWGIDENLTARQYFTLFKWLPKTYQVAGNRNLTRECLSEILETKVEIAYNNAQPIEMGEDTDAVFTCGDGAILGTETVLGNMVDDGTYRWVLNVGPLTKSAVKDFLPNGTKFNLLKIIERIFIPIEVDFMTNLTLQTKKTSNDIDGVCFELNDAINGVLGFTTVL